MRKGSYSEELVKIIAAMITKENVVSTAMLEVSNGRITVVPVAGLCAQFWAMLPQSRNCESVGSHHEVIRGAKIVVEASLTHLLRVGLCQFVWTKIPERQVNSSSATSECVFWQFRQSACIGHKDLGVFHNSGVFISNDFAARA